MNNKIVTIFGGTGFVGSHIVKELAKRDYRIKIICRDPELANILKPLGNVGQIIALKGDITNLFDIEKAIADSDTVINLVGKLFEIKKNDFYNIHVKAAGDIANICAQNNVNKFIHFSALGVDINQSNYAKTKLAGEQLVIKNFPNTLIIRPSIIFGKEDNFLNKFKSMASISPILPLIHRGKTKFQPVYVADIAQLVIRLISDENINAKIIEAAGLKIYNFKEIIEFILSANNQKRCLINLPNSIANLLGKIMDKLMSNPLITADQVKSLKYDNIVSNNYLMLKDFKIEAKSFDIALNYIKN